MAAGITTLRKVQLGWEVTPGTTAAATWIWRGESGGIIDERTVLQVAEHVGYIGGTDRSVVTKYLSTLALDDTPATYEQLQALIALSLGGPTTGSADGAGSDFIYTTNVPETSAPTIVTATVETGNNFEAHKMEFGHCTEWKLSGAHGEAVMMGANLAGQVKTATTFTGALTPYAVKEMMTSQFLIYIDAIGGTYGTTGLSNMLLAFELTVKPTWKLKWTASNTLDFSLAKYTDCEITGRLAFECDTGLSLASGIQKDFVDQTPKKLQLKCQGPAFTSAGTTYTYHTFIANLPIKYTKVGPLGSEEGNDTLDIEFVSNYNTTAADAGQFILVNEKSAL